MFWINLSLLLMLVVGHAEVLVTLVNRAHSRRLQRETLRHLRHLHDVLMTGFPFVLVWFVGIAGPELLHGGSWSNLSLGWSIYLGLCAAGFLALVTTSLKRNLRPTPRAQISNDSWTVDIAKRLGFRPLGNGPYRYLTQVPGNEIFRVQVSQKVYRLPRVQRDWDGLSILHLTDLHFIGTVDRPFFEQVMELSEELEPDLIVFTGDLLDKQQFVEWLPATLGRLKAPLGCYYILGNHDRYCDPPEIRRKMDGLGWQDVSGQSLTIEYKGRPLSIAGTERPWMGQHPDFSDVPQNAFRLLLSHTPDNLPWAKSQQIDLMLSGHNHGGQVRLPLIGPVYSPSKYGCRYASGVFWDEPTLLYVSRGISGQHPLRWRCPPELTKLVLKAADG